MDRAYLSILGWPESLDEAGRTAALAIALDLGANAAGMLARRGTPQVVGVASRPDAEAFERRIAPSGAETFTPSVDAVDGLAPAVQITAVYPTDDASRYVAQRHDGARAGLKLDRVFLLIRAMLKRSATTTRVYNARASSSRLPGVRPRREQRSELKTTELVELHTLGGRRIRIDLRRFVEEPMGIDKLASHRERADILAERFLAGARSAMLDLRFRDFRLPAGHRSAAPDSSGGLFWEKRTADDADRFEFYSAWTSLLHRRMLGLDR